MQTYRPLSELVAVWTKLLMDSKGLHPEDRVHFLRDIVAAEAADMAEVQNATNERIGTPDRNSPAEIEALLEEIFGPGEKLDLTGKEVRVSDFNVTAPLPTAKSVGDVYIQTKDWAPAHLEGGTVVGKHIDQVVFDDVVSPPTNATNQEAYRHFAGLTAPSAHPGKLEDVKPQSAVPTADEVARAKLWNDQINAMLRRPQVWTTATSDIPQPHFSSFGTLYHWDHYLPQQ